MAQTGRFPPVAIPAAKRTACSSAIPTSMKRSGKFFWRASSPVPLGIAAVIPTMSSFSTASWERHSPKTS